MRHLLLFLLIALPFMGTAQGTTCAGMDPICTNPATTYPVNTGTTAAAGNDYGCLLAQPNPNWYYFEVSTAGTIDMSLSAGTDIDFIIYGPYASLAAAQGDCGTLDAGDIVDCSFSASANETPSVTGAQVGEVYIMMITNTAAGSQNVTLTQTGGTGATDCSIVATPPCFMSSFQATVGPCDPATDTYEITGQIDFEDPPATGNLVVEDCNGNIQIVASAPFTVNAQGQGSEAYVFGNLAADGQACDVSAYFTADPTCSIMNLAYTAPICNCFINSFSLNQEPCDLVLNTFDITGTIEFTSPPTTGSVTFTDCLGNSVTYNAPFTSPLNWAITGITPNGTTNCTVTATFSADPACTFTSLPFNHPADCQCQVDAGTFTTSTIGNTNSTGPFFLCFGDSLTIQPNGDFVPPTDIGNPTGGTYNPGMHLLLYNCPPTVFSPNDFTTDPCFAGIWDPNNPAGPWGVTNNFATNTTFYFMPLTLYDYVNYIYSFFFTGALCYDLGPAYPVTFLTPIQTAQIEDCNAGTATVAITGGQPSFDGSLFNIVPGSLVPATASFVNTSAPDLGTITISGLVDGDNYSFDIVDDNGCPITVSGTFAGLEDASFTYDPRYCVDDPDPLPTITGVPGGNFSAAPAGLSLNAATGQIDISASTPGTYTITYQSPAATCFGTETYTITIYNLPAVTAVAYDPICPGEPLQLEEDEGDAQEWFWTTTGAGTFDNDSLDTPIVTGAANGDQFTVTATDVLSGCSNTSSVTITVNTPDDPTFTFLDFCFGDANQGFVTGLAGGTFTFNPDPLDGAVINSATGEITNEVAGTTYNVQYLTNGTCPDSLTLPVTVNALPTVSAPDQTICEGDNVNITATGAVLYTWSPGTALNTTSGATVNASPTTTINYTVTGTDSSGCVSDDIVTVTVNPLPAVDPIADQTLCAGAATNVVNFTSPTAGATFDWTNNTTSIGLGAAGNGDIASFNTVNTGATAVTATVSVSATANGCTGPITTFDIIVNPIPTVDPIADQEVCEGDNTSAINFTGAVAGTQYDWTNSNAGIGVGANGTGDIAAFAGTNTTAGPITGNFNVVPTAAGCVGTAETFAITVNPLPNATIAGTAAVCENDAQPTITFTGSDGVAPYTFTYNINGGANQTITSTGNTATLNVPTTPAGTYNYNLVSVSDANATPCSNNVTGTATITVNPNPTPVITGVLEYCTGFSATLGTANVYNGYTWSNGATTPTADFTIADNPITVTVTDANGCTGTSTAVNVIENNTVVFPSVVEICQGQSATIHGVQQTVAGVYDQTFALPTGCDSTSSVTLVVNPLPVIDAGLDQVACDGAGITLNAVGAANIAWDVPGVTNGNQFFPGVGTVTYTATGTDANGCTNTDAVDVTINPNPTVDPVADQVVCNGDLTTTINFTGAVPGTTYDWVNSDPSIGLGLLAAGNGDITMFGAINNGTVPVVATITVTPTANGCVGTAESFTITVNPTPVVDPILDQNVCNGDLTGIVAFTSTTAGTTFDWTNSDPTIGLAAAGNGDIAAFNAVNNGAIPIVATITVTPTANGCPGTPINFTITVNPSPNVDPILDQTLCNGVLTNPVVFTGASPGTTFDWTNSNTAIGLGGSGTGDIAAFAASNATGGAISGTITVTPVLNGCSGTPETYTITVDPPPTMDPVADQEICVGQSTAGITFTDASGAATFDWLNDNAGIGLAANGSGDIASFVGVNAGATAIIGTVTVVPTLNGCLGLPEQFTITINPGPSVDAGQNVSVCDGDPVTLTATGANTYQWAPAITNGQPFVPTTSGTYYVSGTDVNGCINVDSVVVTVEPIPVVSFTADTTQGCEGLEVTFTNTTPGVFTDCSWTFSNGATANGCGSVTVTFNNAGLFDATLTTVSATGCSNTVTYTDYIYIEADPVAAFTPSSSVLSVFNSQVLFDNNSTGATSYEWDFGDGSSNSTQENPVHTFPSDEAGAYTVWLTAFSPLGCPDSTSRVITVNEELIFYVPNTFTPDNDDFNQNWEVVFTSGYDPFDFNLYIFDRWGEVIWESHDASIGWDATYGNNGRPVQDGTYTWKIDFKTILNDERIEVVGHVNVLR